MTEIRNMNILVINGSPKGKYSITLQSCLYLKKKYPTHSFGILNAGQRIKTLEKDFSPALEAIEKAELLLFCYPVYTFIAPSQIHRFIRLMKESGADFTGKIATQITTSKHFYDVTAHRYIEDNCADMGIRFLDGLSADMDDLLEEKGRRQAEDWFRMTMWSIDKGYFKTEIRSKSSTFVGQPCTIPLASGKSGSRKVVIVADIKAGDTALKTMVDSFIARFPYECELVNLQDFPFQGGCISCFNCAATGKCIYGDGFDDYLRGFIHKHDAIIYAFRIEDHSMGVRFKMYDDRQFCNGHRTVTMGTPFGYITDGPLSKEENLRMIIEGRAQVGGNYLAGVATNEFDTDGQLQKLSDTLCYAMENSICPPQNFLGTGGMKIFRDLIYLMRGMMRADHKFFKSHGQYDFPQKKWKTSLSMYLVGFLMSRKSLRTRMGSKMNEGMIAPYRKVIDRL